MRATTYRQLREMNLDELIELYDKIAGTTQIGLNFIRAEISRRETEKQSQRMLQMTSQMRKLTVVITILTVFNVVLVACQIPSCGCREHHAEQSASHMFVAPRPFQHDGER